MSFMIVVAKVIVVKDIVLHDYNDKRHLKYDMFYSTTSLHGYCKQLVI